VGFTFTATTVSLFDLYTCRRRFVVLVQIVMSIKIDLTIEPIFAKSASETVIAKLCA
jgi:hypothetical protein